MNKPVILTGLRANNDLHIGNYFGALLPIIDMAKNRASDYEINLFVPDLHSFTTPIDHSQLQSQIMHNLKLFVAAGLPLDNPNIRIYRQSYIPAHSELTWILDNFTGFGELTNMTQFKDKSKLSSNEILNTAQEVYDIVSELNKKGVDTQSITVREAIDIKRGIRKDSTSVGLFNYPVLMASDILLYGATYVPVGDDQSQHLEFARDIAVRMNGKFSELFTVPKPVKEQHEFFGHDQGLRIKDLIDPSKKMSKSDESGRGIIFLGDSPEEAAKKIKSATTDSLGKIDFMNEEQAGIRNLLQILALMKGQGYAETADPYQGSEMYGSLKTAVAEAVGVFLKDFQDRLATVDEAALMAKLEADEAAMNEVANATLYKVQKAVGLRA
jgi:tryptophanyl-tRNA synthetase